MEKTLDSLNIRAKGLARRRTFNNAIWDILLQTENVAKSLVGSILMKKTVRLQTTYMGVRKVKVTLLGVDIYIYEDHLLFLSQFGDVSNVALIKRKTGIATGDVEVMITVNRKNFISISNVSLQRTLYLHCSRREPISLLGL